MLADAPLATEVSAMLQTLVVASIVFLAAVFVARRVVQSLRKAKAKAPGGCDCGGQ